ncbi:MAG: MoaD/ThiS family protein [Reichenbachiella sp.]
MAEIIIPTPLRKFAGGQSKLPVSGSTVIEAINGLVAAHPDLKRHVFDHQGALKRFIKVYLGDEDIEALDGDDTKLKDNSVISIIPAIAGGLAG